MVGPWLKGLFVEQGDPSEPSERVNFLLGPAPDFSERFTTILFSSAALNFLLVSVKLALVKGRTKMTKGVSAKQDLLSLVS